MRYSLSLFVIAAAGLLTTCSGPSGNQRNDSGRLEVLFLGHDSEHHNSAILLPLLASRLSLEGISFTCMN